MGDPEDPRQTTYEEERLIGWTDRHGLDLTDDASEDLWRIVASLQGAAYDQGMSDQQQVQRFKVDGPGRGV